MSPPPWLANYGATPKLQAQAALRTADPLACGAAELDTRLIGRVLPAAGASPRWTLADELGPGALWSEEDIHLAGVEHAAGRRRWHVVVAAQRQACDCAQGAAERSRQIRLPGHVE